MKGRGARKKEAKKMKSGVNVRAGSDRKQHGVRQPHVHRRQSQFSIPTKCSLTHTERRDPSCGLSLGSRPIGTSNPWG